MKKNVYICITESFHCTVGINTLQMNYTCNFFFKGPEDTMELVGSRNNKKQYGWRGVSKGLMTSKRNTCAREMWSWRDMMKA